MGMGFELADEGELYMICQGSGGGYGDLRERDPDAVMADLEADYISHWTAREIYFVVCDEQTLAVDADATKAARDGEREARKQRGIPYADFVQDWVTPEPPQHLPYYGSWGDDNQIIARPRGPHSGRRASAGRWPSCRRSTCPIPRISRSHSSRPASPSSSPRAVADARPRREPRRPSIRPGGPGLV
jgi:hypothetical protein